MTRPTAPVARPRMAAGRVENKTPSARIMTIRKKQAPTSGNKNKAIRSAICQRMALFLSFLWGIARCFQLCIAAWVVFNIYSEGVVKVASEKVARVVQVMDAEYVTFINGDNGTRDGDYRYFCNDKSAEKILFSCR